MQRTKKRAPLFEHGMRQVTHTFNCMSSARSTREFIVNRGCLEFAMSEPEILCELIADGHHVLPTLMKMLYRAKGPDGICLVTDATAGRGFSRTSAHFSLGGSRMRCSKTAFVLLAMDRRWPAALRG